MYYVYILYSLTSDKYYVGQTDNLELRLKFHNELSDFWRTNSRLSAKGKRLFVSTLASMEMKGDIWRIFLQIHIF